MDKRKEKLSYTILENAQIMISLKKSCEKEILWTYWSHIKNVNKHHESKQSIKSFGDDRK